MVTPLIYTGIAALTFMGWLFLCEIEQKRGKRLLLSGFRARLDRGLTFGINMLLNAGRYVLRYVITLSWYYSIHHALKLSLQAIAGVYHMLESILIKNRDKTRALRRERRQNTLASPSHLNEIAEHKAEMKLSPSEIKKRRDRALKGR